MSRNTKVSVLFIGLISLLLAGGVYWCWEIRETPDSRKEVRKTVARELRALQGDAACAYLENLASERFFHTWFDDAFPCLHVAIDTRVPADTIAQFAEDTFLKFAGNGGAGSEDIPHLKRVMAFIDAFLPRCTTAAAANGIRDRLLDGHFLTGDFDAAIALLEKGMPGHDPGWCTSTVAKLRAHRALETASKPGLSAEAVKKAKEEAIANFTLFGEYMLTDAMKDFEDCDPTTGVIYSFDWVAAKNFIRSARLAGEIGEKAKADELTARAKKYYATALEKAKDDAKSLETLKDEMKSYGL